MANITIHSSFDMDDLFVGYEFDGGDYIDEADATQIVITDGQSYRDIWRGDFQFAPGSGPSLREFIITGLTGTVTGFDRFEQNALVFSVENAALSASTVYSFIRNRKYAELLRFAFSSDDQFTGSDFSDDIKAFVGNDQVNAGAGDDVIDGGEGQDVMAGGLGSDSYFVDNAGDQVVENAELGSVDTVFSTVSYILVDNVENLVLQGKASLNATGNAGDNELTGNAAANELDGLAGDDVMKGGAGNDIYVVDSAGDVAIEDLSGVKGGIDLVKSSVDFTLGANLENLTLIGNQDVDGFGNALDNRIIGNDGNNYLNGLGGKDSLLGGAGNDILDGIDGFADILKGQSGNDQYGVSLIKSGASAVLEDTIEEAKNEGTDRLFVITRTPTLQPIDLQLSKAVTVTLPDNVEELIGFFSYVNKLNFKGNALDNLISGNDADNVIDGGEGADALEGRDGNDVYVVNSLDDSVWEDAGKGIDSVNVNIAQAGGTYVLGNFPGQFSEVEHATLISKVAYNLTGNSLNNQLVGNAAANILRGEGGNDILDGRGGSDEMIGGLGDDTYYVDTAADRIDENQSEGFDTVLTSIGFELGDHLEALTLTGKTAINATGNALNNTLTGNSGANTLDGRGGADTMSGGLGNDVYIVDDAGDTVNENANEGIDSVRVNIASGATAYTLSNNVENALLINAINFNLIGNELKNTLTGNAHDNQLTGGLGVDTLIGGAGDDLYRVNLNDKGAIEDVIKEVAGGGIDTVFVTGSYGYAKAKSLTLAKHLEKLDISDTGDSKLNLTGNELGNLIQGNAWDNLIKGLAGSDWLKGGDGDDVLIGGLANDKLEGGSGNDRFRFESALDGLTNVDDIDDFQGGDLIELDNAIFKQLKGNSLASGSFRASNAVTALEEDDFILYDTSNGALFYDADGSGAKAAVQFATLVGVPEISSDSFSII